tara:strand:- start:145 stop:621 length:477 start_codon:yes stop_codon:yes gene_type:complete
LNIEIERKFLVNEMPNNIDKTISIKQYYLMNEISLVQRLRLFDNKYAILSFKQKTNELSKYEFEYEIPYKDALKMIEFLPSTPFIEKKRHICTYDNLKWDIDEFRGKNAGLIVAEIELDNEKQHIKLPKWIDKEVTNQNKYYNFNLALKPYILWKKGG